MPRGQGEGVPGPPRRIGDHAELIGSGGLRIAGHGRSRTLREGRPGASDPCRHQ